MLSAFSSSFLLSFQNIMCCHVKRKILNIWLSKYNLYLQARIQGRWNGWIFTPLFLSLLLSFFPYPSIFEIIFDFSDIITGKNSPPISKSWIRPWFAHRHYLLSTALSSVELCSLKCLFFVTDILKIIFARVFLEKTQTRSVMARLGSEHLRKRSVFLYVVTFMLLLNK